MQQQATSRKPSGAAAASEANSGQSGAKLDHVESRLFTIRDFRLECGRALPEVTLAYETYGRLAPGGRNAVLLTHGFTSHHHAAGRYAPGKAGRCLEEDEPGWWDALIGPGRPFDTDRMFCVSSNMLGSCYGSTNPASRNPETGRPYGPDFPPVALPDIVRAQRALLDHLGVEHLIAVAGPSYGGYQAFQWAVTFPDFMHGIVAAVTAPKGSGADRSVRDLMARFTEHPNWNGGWYYDKGGVRDAMVEFRIATLKRYGIEQQLAHDSEERERVLHALAERWADAFDANALIALRKAAAAFDAERDFARIKAKVLYVLSTTDRLFPASIGPENVERMRAAGVDVTYFELKSDKGHLASGADAGNWAPILRDFLHSLPAN